MPQDGNNIIMKLMLGCTPGNRMEMYLIQVEKNNCEFLHHFSYCPTFSRETFIYKMNQFTVTLMYPFSE